MKRKEMDALIVKQNVEIIMANSKIADYEKELDDYRQREDSIVEALTTASETKKRVLAQAEKELANAQAQAMKAVENAKKEANAIIVAAQEKANHLLAKAMKKCEKMELEAAAKIKEQNAIHDEMGFALANIAQKLQNYIENFQPKFSGSSTEKKVTKSEIDFPDEYESPAELYHYILKINAENDGVEVETPNVVERTTKAPKFLTVTEDLLSAEEIDNAIETSATLGDKVEDKEKNDDNEGNGENKDSVQACKNFAITATEEQTDESIETAQSYENDESDKQPSDFEAEMEKVRDAVLAVLEE
ncbi:MAG: ATP synthase F0 subunit B [Clostridiales bacterium]|nr:ATP synthase F0 subunit B [Clostridiales bacterium]